MYNTAVRAYLRLGARPRSRCGLFYKVVAQSCTRKFLWQSAATPSIALVGLRRFECLDVGVSYLQIMSVIFTYDTLYLNYSSHYNIIIAITNSAPLYGIQPRLASVIVSYMPSQL